MTTTVLVGGARSGKSVLAMRLASTHPGPVVFVATAEERDDEMTERIAEHRAARPAEWVTVEEPIALAEAVANAPAEACVVVDCLTLWVSNLLERGADHDEVVTRAQRASKETARRSGPVIVVTNDVGSGIVPMHPETRTYRDLMGTVNATFANDADRVLLVAAGRALPLTRFEDVTP